MAPWDLSRDFSFECYSSFPKGVVFSSKSTLNSAHCNGLDDDDDFSERVKQCRNDDDDDDECGETYSFEYQIKKPQVVLSKVRELDFVV